MRTAPLGSSAWCFDCSGSVQLAQEERPSVNKTERRETGPLRDGTICRKKLSVTLAYDFSFTLRWLWASALSLLFPWLGKRGRPSHRSSIYDLDSPLVMTTVNRYRALELHFALSLPFRFFPSSARRNCAPRSGESYGERLRSAGGRGMDAAGDAFDRSSQQNGRERRRQSSHGGRERRERASFFDAAQRKGGEGGRIRSLFYPGKAGRGNRDYWDSAYRVSCRQRSAQISGLRPRLGHLSLGC